jgi:Family of unknown function (DUF5326)
MKKLFGRLPAWVRWGLLPVVAILVFGSLIMSIIGFLVGLLFKVLLLVALVAIVLFVAKQVTNRR